MRGLLTKTFLDLGPEFCVRDVVADIIKQLSKSIIDFEVELLLFVFSIINNKLQNVWDLTEITAGILNSV